MTKEKEEACILRSLPVYTKVPFISLSLTWGTV